MTDLRKAALTQERLKKFYLYDPQTGIFERIKRMGGHLPNKVAGYKNPNGYIYIQMDGKNYRAHRLAWLYVYGEFPKNHIDHINKIKDDNRIENLRDVTHKVNIQNTCKPRTNTSGIKGVTWIAKKNKWLASIKHFGKSIHLGYYETIEQAQQARIDGEIKLW